MNPPTEQLEPFRPKGTMQSKTGLPQSNSHVNLNNALNSLTVVLKNLESKVKEAETSSNKLGQILVAKKIITVSDLSEAMERKKLEPHKYLGQILCEMGFPQSIIMKNIYFSNKRKKLGEILVELNIITTQQLEDVLVQQENQKNCGLHKYLGALLAKNKVISEENYIRALSAHFSMPVVSLKNFKVFPTLQKAIGEQYALRNRIVVLSNSPEKVGVAIAEPHISIFEHLEKAMPKGKYILFCLARSSEIENCLDDAYDPFSYVLD